jgi:hypothetical protein
MRWQSPTFEEINMSAEIGAYEGDSGDDDHRAPDDDDDERTAD